MRSASDAQGSSRSSSSSSIELEKLQNKSHAGHFLL
jgi:hypothetical protein